MVESLKCCIRANFKDRFYLNIQLRSFVKYLCQHEKIPEVTQIVSNSPSERQISLNITVSVYYVSGSKVNRKERSRPSFLVCFVFHLAKYINLGAFGRAFGSVVSVSCLERETGLGSMCGTP